MGGPRKKATSGRYRVGYHEVDKALDHAMQRARQSHLDTTEKLRLFHEEHERNRVTRMAEPVNKPRPNWHVPTPQEIFNRKDSLDTEFWCRISNCNYYILDRENCVICSYEFETPGVLCIVCDSQTDKPVTHKFYENVDDLIRAIESEP